MKLIASKIQKPDWRRAFFDWTRESPSDGYWLGDAKRTNQKPCVDREIVFWTVILPVPCIYFLSHRLFDLYELTGDP